MAEVIEVNDIDELAHYRMAWNALLPKTPHASFFHTFDWFLLYWKHHPELQMRVLVIRSCGDVIGIVPFCIVAEQHRLATVRVLSYPLSDWGTWYGPIGANQSASLFMAMRHLNQTAREWDEIDLRWCSAGPGQRDATNRAMAAVGWRPIKQEYQESSLIDMSDRSWDEYLAGLSKKWRHELRRQARRLHDAGEVEVVRHRPAPAAEGDGDAAWNLFDECVGVSQRSWQASSTDGNTLCHQDVREFLTDAHLAAARLGMLDITVLKFEGQPAAFHYGYHYNGRLYGLRMGYDQQFAHLGVGKVMVYNLIRDCFHRKDRSLDLGNGDQAFKRYFRSETRTSYRYSYAPWHAMKSQGVRLSHWVRDRLGFQTEKRSAMRA